MADFDEIMKVPEAFKRDGRVYAWVLDHPTYKNTMIQAQADGAVTVKTTDEDGQKFLDANDIRIGVDGLIHAGDTVLMSYDAEEYAKMEREKSIAANPHRQIAAIKQEFNETARASGIKPLDDEDFRK